MNSEELKALNTLKKECEIHFGPSFYEEIYNDSKLGLQNLEYGYIRLKGVLFKSYFNKGNRDEIEKRMDDGYKIKLFDSNGDENVKRIVFFHSEDRKYIEDQQSSYCEGAIPFDVVCDGEMQNFIDEKAYNVKKAR